MKGGLQFPKSEFAELNSWRILSLLLLLHRFEETSRESLLVAGVPEYSRPRQLEALITSEGFFDEPSHSDPEPDPSKALAMCKSEDRLKKFVGFMELKDMAVA
jgi:hypothetical protein